MTVPKCKRGHRLTDDNVAIWTSGRGDELAWCNRDRAAAWRERNADKLTRNALGTGLPRKASRVTPCPCS
jgi:hypothetical protein